MKQFLNEFYYLIDNEMIDDSFKSRINLQYYTDRPVDSLIIEKTKRYCKEFYIKTKDIIAKITENQINLIRENLIKISK